MGCIGGIREEVAPAITYPPATADEAITGDDDIDFREDRSYGLLKQLVAHGLVIRRADGQGFKGSQHMQLDSVISHRLLDKF